MLLLLVLQKKIAFQTMKQVFVLSAENLISSRKYTICSVVSRAGWYIRTSTHNTEERNMYRIINERDRD